PVSRTSIDIAEGLRRLRPGDAVAFAARCARCVLPLFADSPFGREHPEHVRALTGLVEEVERHAAGRGGLVDADAVAPVARIADAAVRAGKGDGAAARAAYTVVHAADAARARADDPDDVFEAAGWTCYAALQAAEADGSLQAELALLLKRAA